MIMSKIYLAPIADDYDTD